MRPSENILFSIFLFLGIYVCASQSFNLDSIRKAYLISLSGGLDANSVSYEGSSPRAPFTYFLKEDMNSETFKHLASSHKAVLTDLLEAVDMQTQANHYKEKALYFLAAFYTWKYSDYKKALQPPNDDKIKKQ